MKKTQLHTTMGSQDTPKKQKQKQNTGRSVESQGHTLKVLVPQKSQGRMNSEERVKNKGGLGSGREWWFPNLSAH